MISCALEFKHIHRRPSHFPFVRTSASFKGPSSRPPGPAKPLMTLSCRAVVPTVAGLAAGLFQRFRSSAKFKGRWNRGLHINSQSASTVEVREADGLIREEFTLKHNKGSVEGVAIRKLLKGGEAVPTVLVNTGCYGTLKNSLQKIEGPTYAKQGYAYVIVCAGGSRDEIADGLFLRWQADAKAVLKWLGQQKWCNGRVGCHGYSLLGNTAYAALSASSAEDTPDELPRVQAIVPAISFSRICPTIFLQGQGLAAELALRFLWLAEVGLRPERSALEYLSGMFSFFVFRDWPGLQEAVALRPIKTADVSMWGRANVLWRGGATYREPSDEFWKLRDIQCEFDKVLGEPENPPKIQVIAGWHDMFLLQSLADFLAAHHASGCAHLVIYTGGHFGLVFNHQQKVTQDTLTWYDEHLRDEPCEKQARVRMQVIGDDESGRWLECDSWPPPTESCIQLYLSARSDQSKTTGVLEKASSPQKSHFSYKYDPADPTPYAGSGWLNLRKDGEQDQRDLEQSRCEDLLVFTSEPLENPLDVVGEVSATLFASCSAPECDLVARLCAVRVDNVSETMRSTPLTSVFTAYSDKRDLGPGISLNVCEGIVRVDFKGEQSCCQVKLSLGPTACHFRQGDRIRLHVCSAAHPRWLRHPLQPVTEDWLEGAGALGPPAKISIFSDADRPSCLHLPLLSSAVRESKT